MSLLQEFPLDIHELFVCIDCLIISDYYGHTCVCENCDPYQYDDEEGYYSSEEDKDSICPDCEYYPGACCCDND